MNQVESDTTKGAYGSNLFKAIGPGILVASAAIGGSHLVWSTRAGAEYGFSLVWLILLANLFKYPFFLYGHRYTVTTGESLLAGYYRQGRAFIYVFLIINILTGTINIAGVAMLTAALLAAFGFVESSVPMLTVLILVFCASTIIFGHYKMLDKVSKVVMALLCMTTFVALFLAVSHGPVAGASYVGPSPWNWQSFPFLIVLLGWMPAPVDLSAWSSLWIFGRKEETNHFATDRETSIDFHLGYIMTVVMAVVFLVLGKLVMYGSGESFSDSGVVFSHQLVTLYSTYIGDSWRLMVLAAAFLTMFGTTITCVDGYPRSLAASCALIVKSSQERFQSIFRFWILFSLMASVLIVLMFKQNLLMLLGFAAVVSFVTSPVLAYINYRVMNGSNVPKSHRPGLGLKLLSCFGLVFFVLMSVGYVYVIAR